jgi:hypothetical protein
MERTSNTRVCIRCWGYLTLFCEYYKCMGGSVVMAIPAALGTALPYGRMYVD